MTDRLDVEHLVTCIFGKKSSEAEHAGKVLVATQVVEQSLDLDFDVLATVLAPVDFVIQRMGRLWRHERSRRRGASRTGRRRPEPVDDAGGEWFRAAFPWAAHVYADHTRLWLTARRLDEAGVKSRAPMGADGSSSGCTGPQWTRTFPKGCWDTYWEPTGAPARKAALPPATS